VVRSAQSPHRLLFCRSLRRWVVLGAQGERLLALSVKAKYDGELARLALKRHTKKHRW
jgi:hypothetical protein